jgi:hypothetical protein
MCQMWIGKVGSRTPAAVDAVAASAVPALKVTSLEHEPGHTHNRRTPSQPAIADPGSAETNAHAVIAKAVNSPHKACCLGTPSGSQSHQRQHHHSLVNDTVEGDSLVTKPLLTSGCAAGGLAEGLGCETCSPPTIHPPIESSSEAGGIAQGVTVTNRSHC